MHRMCPSRCARRSPEGTLCVVIDWTTKVLLLKLGEAEELVIRDLIGEWRLGLLHDGEHRQRRAALARGEASAEVDSLLAAEDSSRPAHRKDDGTALAPKGGGVDGGRISSGTALDERRELSRSRDRQCRRRGRRRRREQKGSHNANAKRNDARIPRVFHKVCKSQAFGGLPFATIS